AARHLLRLRVDRHHTATRERSNVWPALLVQSKIPSRDGLPPIAKDFCECLRPIGPVRGIVWSGIVRAAFGPIDLRIGISVVELAHLIRRSDIPMKGDCVTELVHSGIIELCHGPSP